MFLNSVCLQHIWKVLITCITYTLFCLQGEGHEFKFPEIFKVKSSPLEREMKDVNRVKRADQVEEQQSWERASVPPWFRY